MYNTVLCTIMDKHAPVKTKVIPVCPQPEWYTEEVRKAKQQRRQCERLWRKTKLTVHRDMYVNMKVTVNTMRARAKTAYFQNLISENSGDSSKLFSVVSKLLGKKKTPSLTQDKEPNELQQLFH